MHDVLRVCVLETAGLANRTFCERSSACLMCVAWKHNVDYREVSTARAALAACEAWGSAPYNMWLVYNAAIFCFSSTSVAPRVVVRWAISEVCGKHHSNSVFFIPEASLAPRCRVVACCWRLGGGKAGSCGRRLTDLSESSRQDHVAGIRVSPLSFKRAYHPPPST